MGTLRRKYSIQTVSEAVIERVEHQSQTYVLLCLHQSSSPS